MIGKFKVILSRGDHSATYVLTYCENEAPRLATREGAFHQFHRLDGSEVDFSSAHMDKLQKTVQDWAAEAGAEGFTEELTGWEPHGENPCRAPGKPV